MTKRLCKLSRHDIADSLGQINALVADAKYVCRSCARASQDRSRLCKPHTMSQPKSSLLTPVLDATPVEETVQTPETSLPAVSHEVTEYKMSKKELKKTKKMVKAQKKYLRKMAKMVKKQSKLLKKQKKIERQLQNVNMAYSALPSHSSLH